MGASPTAWPDTPGTDIPGNDAPRRDTDQTEINVDWRKAAVQRVLSSLAFAKANRLSTFLEYVCRLTLDGREDEINEVNIGINVFERRENYNASDDTIVRTTARSLRQRLKSYYETEGYADSVRIDIPKGTYVPTFVQIGVESARVISDPSPLADWPAVTTAEIANAEIPRPWSKCSGRPIMQISIDRKVGWLPFD
jgi:hypothetical protein